MMERLENCQFDLASRIEKSKVNFLKSSNVRLSKEFLEGKLELLEGLWNEFLSGHRELLRTTEPKVLSESRYMRGDTYDKTEDFYIDYKCKLKGALSKFVIIPSFSNTDSNQPTLQAPNVKLPKVNIPIFSGKYSEWNTFRDLFQSLIHTNKTLGNAQKLLYLKGYLQGEAEQLLCNIPITDSNYDYCWGLLDERYNNKRYICHHILKRLLSQKNVTCESASGLKGLMDTTNDCLSALSNIGIDTSTWDVLVIHIIMLKLDPESKRQWEFSVADNNSTELPNYDQFEQFLKNRYRALEFLTSESKPMPNKTLPVFKMKTMHVATLVCPFCKKEHKLSTCKAFRDTSVKLRREFVASHNVCFCCLGNNHSAKFCHSKYKCRICKRKHHALLHPTNKIAAQEPQNGEVTTADTKKVGAVISCTSTRSTVDCSQVLLATALVDTVSKYGQTYTIRSLLDQGSQSSFITEAMVELLGLKKIPAKGQIVGVGDTNGLTTKSMVEIKIASRVDPNFIITVKAYVLESITSLLPNRKIRAEEWKELENIVLADPSYYTSNSVDLLLGSEVYSRVIQNGVIKGPLGSPLAQCSSLGWILSGVVHTTTKPSETINVMHCSVEDNQLLRKFRKLEDDIPLPKKGTCTKNEETCEEYFTKTSRTDDTGRHIVRRLPLKDEDPDEKNSRQTPEKRTYSLERRLKNGDLKQKYTEVTGEYVDMNLDLGEDSSTAAEKILSDFHVDDLMMGCGTIDQGSQLYREMNMMLTKEGFELQKWTTNNEDLVKTMKEDGKVSLRKGNEEGLKRKADKIIKSGGITWNRSEDVYRYKVDVQTYGDPETKRKGKIKKGYA
ncbi:uncharacterized protein LOC135073752 [Ostrinia nubilalis]|uniref:uncharacterized protein LOC135073752 n=1 Tax=Ostrinia nubilalis TaxID=29057 RepID=UPI00308231D2